MRREATSASARSAFASGRWSDDASAVSRLPNRDIGLSSPNVYEYRERRPPDSALWDKGRCCPVRRSQRGPAAGTETLMKGNVDDT